MQAARFSSIVLMLILCWNLAACASRQEPAPQQAASSTNQEFLPLGVFYALMADNRTAARALDRVATEWKDAYAAMLLDMIYFSTSPETDAGMTRLLERASGLEFQGDYDPFFRWLWSFDPGQHPEYAEFKATLYERIDPRFREYFDNQPRAAIRLDEVLWGGVSRDGIPPLVDPKMVSAAEATYLADDNILFGVHINGDARAYPKRILAWHEMVRDRIGGRPLTGVYCTLCGAMILYDAEVNGVSHILGTSGFLYRSNKLMYDKATASLWSTLTGEPVIGPLLGRGIKLKTLPVVTTTWKEWKTRHPNTLVLSLDTGQERDYSEGAAYSDYFATDRLMFAVPKLDRRLPNKAEVLALRYKAEPLAIAASFLARNPLYQDRVGGVDFVVLTDASGANRVFDSAGVRFASWDRKSTAYDDSGRAWTLTESEMVAADGRRLQRLSAHRSFWFGWYSQFPQTRLVR